ncbi:hydantoinase/oxoprolinase family protein [Amycolatopsis rhizosphaerae]|uniref:Hydantoinase/oxoprolinase family protein n=1 Tax=Amycolatopsis rhizosphaerae TaxID=2053003 RepID=A0A558C089_9PSEU|nr:hydantoinase/oxoprolinase family protein [Amycolatopsis rhizosphaerae]TVT42186.1 hydantoinase/oxoprolinase family protein [Amycolatopsis rhizosphaerae]
MDTLINIDNGGTLTDICVWDGTGFTFTKTLTTPHDLSECLFSGIEKASAARYGTADIERLLHATQHIRYSTTQGTNALVERRGPMIGILTTLPGLDGAMRGSKAERELFDGLVGERVLEIDGDAGDEEIDFEVVQRVNRLATLGAARVVVAGRDPEQERRLRAVLLRRFPRHLLGSIPLIYSWDLAGDRNDARRVWSCVLNSFLHPTMERFLYGAERRLKSYKVANPLLVYRNDGASSRVAKSVALKTYSSGPRGGLEGTAALARQYGLAHTLMIDIGGTTTDVGVVSGDRVAADERGRIRGVPISYPMSDVHSKGVGGSSVIAVENGRITVGPRSVGAAPGPACFGFGGKQATITDVNLLLGVLDPDTYLDGTFRLDPERSRAVITETIADPLGIGLEEALVRMEQAYFEALSSAFAHLVTEDTTLAAFGGAGPMSATGAARPAGVKRVLVPRTAAVFSALGISFSDIGKTYEVCVPEPTTESVKATHDELLVRAGRDMFQEGYALAACETAWEVSVEDEDGTPVARTPYRPGDPAGHPGRRLSLRLTVTAPLPHPELAPDRETGTRPAPAAGTRSVRSAADRVDEVPVHVLTELAPGDGGAGPAIVEGPFFTARVLPGWTFRVTAAGDLLLHDTH